MNGIRKEPIKEAIILLLYFTLKPVYLGESGFLQISDIVLILSLGYMVIKSGGKISFSQDNYSILKLFFFIIIYQIIINAIWQTITGDKAMSRHDLYYIFNFFAFAGCLYIGQRTGIDTVKRAVGLGGFMAVIVTAIGLIFFQGTGTRSTGFFNNPNQLGYFAVIVLTVIAICKDQMNKLQIGTILIISLWSAISSLSKAAIIAYFVEIVVLILFYQNNRSVKRLVIEFILLLLIGSAIYILLYSNNSLVLNNRTLYEMRYRILRMTQENDSGLAYGRGYARVGEILPDIIWGTGEGAYERFTARHGTEVHSTFVSLLTCYGLIGLVGYMGIFKRCMGKRICFRQSAIALLGMFLYAVTHNGIRNTLLWIIMAILALQNTELKRIKEKGY